MTGLDGGPIELLITFRKPSTTGPLGHLHDGNAVRRPSCYNRNALYHGCQAGSRCTIPRREIRHIEGLRELPGGNHSHSYCTRKVSQSQSIIRWERRAYCPVAFGGVAGHGQVHAPNQPLDTPCLQFTRVIALAARRGRCRVL